MTVMKKKGSTGGKTGNVLPMAQVVGGKLLAPEKLKSMIAKSRCGHERTKSLSLEAKLRLSAKIAKELGREEAMKTNILKVLNILKDKAKFATTQESPEYAAVRLYTEYVEVAGNFGFTEEAKEGIAKALEVLDSLIETERVRHFMRPSQRYEASYRMASLYVRKAEIADGFGLEAERVEAAQKAVEQYKEIGHVGNSHIADAFDVAIKFQLPYSDVRAIAKEIVVQHMYEGYDAGVNKLAATYLFSGAEMWDMATRAIKLQIWNERQSCVKDMPERTGRKYRIPPEEVARIRAEMPEHLR